ncbi:MAG: STAS domain-containing protein [Acidimicrobiia bacterium]|nr:STAS domain-containing protein [Acidimicrobiia bacterium]NNL70834.1 SulP family inorganic anion transporter [Acidimicrobiia bacterium]
MSNAPAETGPLPPATKLTRGDLIAGLSVALVLIPQSLAYAELAGLPAYFGLYAAALPPIAAAFFASSRYLQTGPGAVTALLTFGALSAFAAPFSQEWVELAALLALVVGVTRIMLGLVRGGVIAYFMSQPVLVGFTAAAAILIVSSQLPTAVGVTAEGDKILSRLWWTLTHVDEWEIAAIALSLITVILVAGGRRLHRLFPGVLVAVAIGLLFSVATDYAGLQVGEVDLSLPQSPFGLDWSDGWSLIVPGAVIALVGFAEPASIARIYAAQDRERWSPNRELVSQGVANLASGLSGGFPVGGSFSRTSINHLAGGQTRWSGAISGAAVLAFLPIAGVMSNLPRAVLAAIVVAAVARLIGLRRLVRFWQQSRAQALVAWFTFGATLALSPRIDIAVVLGIGLGITVHLWREVRVPVGSAYADGVLTIKPQGVVFFGSSPDVEAAMLNLLADYPYATRVVFDLAAVGRIDLTGALALKALVEDTRSAGLDAQIASIPPHARRVMTAVWDGDATRGHP